jgi:hypothetical protein
MEAEPVIYRDEAVGLMFSVNAILREVESIRSLPEDNDDGEEVQEDLE